MENIPVTAYSGFSNVRGEITLRKVIEDITKGIQAKLVLKIRLHVSQGKMEEANNVKKQLPFYTVTAGYREKRQAYSITRYTHIILLDIDDQPEEKLEGLREKINGDPNTLASFLTPKAHGFKIFVFMRTKYAMALRESLAKTGMDFPTLEKHHRMMYDACKEYYEKLLDVEVDGSGKDISRGFFTSFDEKAYLNEKLMKEVDETLTDITPPEKPRPGRKKAVSEKVISEKAVSEKVMSDKPEGGKVEAEPWERMEFNKAVLAVKRISKFEPGKRDCFIFALGNKCYTKGLEEEVVMRLAQEKFGSEEFNAAAPIHNAYIYTDRTTEANMRKEEGKPDTIHQLLDFLKTHYDFRRNIIMDRLEYLNFNEDTEKWIGKFRPVKITSYNAIFLDLQLAEIKCSPDYLKTIVNSSYPRDFNPFTDYIESLKPWDGVTDYIGQLAETVQTEDQEFWKKSFRRWFVGMLACALQDEAVNHLVIILYSEQGKGKSTWIRRLLPPEWREYYRNGMANPENKDHQLMLSTHLIINMEEFDGARISDLAGLKRTITQESVKSIRHADTILHTARVLHCQHQQPAVPAGYRRKQTISALFCHFDGLQDTRQLRRDICAGIRVAERGISILVRRRRDRRTEPAQRNAPHEGSGGGESAGIFPKAGTRRHLREVDARSSHTQQDCHLRKDTGEQAGDTDIGTVAGEIQIPHEKERAGKHRI